MLSVKRPLAARGRAGTQLPGNPICAAQACSAVQVPHSRTLERPTLGSVRSFCADGNANVPSIHTTSHPPACGGHEGHARRLDAPPGLPVSWGSPFSPVGPPRDTDSTQQPSRVQNGAFARSRYFPGPTPERQFVCVCGGLKKVQIWTRTRKENMHSRIDIRTCTSHFRMVVLM